MGRTLEGFTLRNVIAGVSLETRMPYFLSVLFEIAMYIIWQLEWKIRCDGFIGEDDIAKKI